MRSYQQRSSNTCSCTSQCLHSAALLHIWLHLMHARSQSMTQRCKDTVRQQDDRCLSQAVYSQLLGDQLCICVLVLCIQVHKVYSCMQGDMEGVRQQAEQHLAAAHAEARSTIQKAQATAADLQVNTFAHLCRVACIDSRTCVCVCVCVCVGVMLSSQSLLCIMSGCMHFVTIS